MQSLRDPEQPPVIPATNAKIKITTEQLLIGDVLLRTDDQKEIILFERKSLQDLLASIKDGRYKEQSHRLTHTSGLNPHHIVYIIEGVLSTLRPQDKKIVLSAIASLSYFKGFSVFRTATVFETAEQILAMATKIQKEFEGGSTIPVYHSATAIPSSQEPGLETQEGNVERTVALSEEHVPYSSFVKKAKKDNITPENIGGILLCQIPGISSTIAAEVLRNFDGSFCRLIDEIRTHPEKLDTIYLESAGGKKRKLSSSVIAAIKTYLVK
jgi:ERCC4-type nuclease